MRLSKDRRLPPGPDPPEVVYVVVEIPRGGRNRYEYDAKKDFFRLDRVLYSAVHYPADYGFVPATLAEDGDPIDILVMTSEPSFPGCLLEARPVGLLRMEDEKGKDEKILAVALADPHYAEVFDLAHVPPHFLREVEHFFLIYKELEGKKVRSFGWEGREAALHILREVIAAGLPV
ncbi:MAG: inorganic diphosphatase [Deltaproteobacteria bacterium]|nr:inorganic diphosphatase [Deltaproteobacteria bacterium]